MRVDNAAMSGANGKPRRDFDDPLRFFPRAITKSYSMWLTLTYPFVSVGRKLSIHYTCDLRRTIAHRVKFGDFLVIREHVWFTPGVPDEQRGEPLFIIEDRCCIDAHCQLSARNCIHLEPDVMISRGVLLMDHSHEYENVSVPIRDQGKTEGGRIRIEQGCWIGHGAAIVASKGDLVLGRNCVVGANSVVTKSAPPYSVLSGNPARIVKQFDPGKGVWVLGAVPAVQG